jgi:hypothetical protein
MTALEQSIRDLEEAKAKCAMIEKLKAFITVPIMTLHLFNDCWITTGAMSLEEAIKYMKTRKLKGYKLKAHKSTYNSSEDFELFVHTEFEGTKLKIQIPVNSIKETIMKFRRTGSTSRSRATGIDVLKGIAPFNGYKVCHGLFTAEFYI